MKIKQAVELLREYNKWRRGGDALLEMPNPKDIGEAIDTVLALADKLMSEPSEGMCEAYDKTLDFNMPMLEADREIYAKGFKAMRDQMIKELENE